ncbi:MAG: S9 family peptidase [Nevskia sp.]|nr:S9 family peptidase [Nevskia sp.]
MKHYWLAMLGLLPGYAAAEVPIAAFARPADFAEVTISPQGEYLAAVLPAQEPATLAVMRVGDGKIVGRFALQANRSIYRYSWVGPHRLVVESAYPSDLLDMPGRTGELVGFDADGGNVSYLFGYLGAAEVGTHLHQVGITRGWASVIDPLSEDPHHAVIAVDDFPNLYSADRSASALADVQITTSYRLNVDNGMLDHKLAAPIRGYSHFLADAAGAVRYSVGYDEHHRLVTHYMDAGASDWTAVNAGDLSNAEVIPLRFSADGARVYLDSDEGGDRRCLVEHELKSGQRRKLSCDAAADLGDVFFSAGREPLAALYLDDMPRLKLLDSGNPMRARLEMLQKAFPGRVVKPVSQTTDGSKMVLLVYSDRDPGAYYLFDSASMKAAFLMAQREAIDPEQMSERRPVQFKARDGQTLHGYLTLPRGREPKNLPLVVHPHGGPFRVADQWRWDADSQLLASRGYAVLQINFRGSGGYGRQFVDAGKQHWDSAMIDDISDGTRWAIQQGIADPARACIYGASYGGYAALMGAVSEPDLYKCAIGYAGVYDLNLWQHDSDVAESRSGRTYIEDFVGATPERLKQASPLTHIDRLKAAVMIVHGEEDQRVPFSQAQALRKALDERHLPYEWLSKPGAGHGFNSPGNREELYTRLLAFLNRNIGEAAAGKADAPPAEAGAAAQKQVP